MDHHPIIENKPLSYGTWETVLKHMDLKTRQKIHRHIPSCRPINSRIPFILDTVHFESSKVLKINETTWILECMSEEKLFNEYIQNGTRIRTLRFDYLPKFLSQKNPENFQIYVRELRISQMLMNSVSLEKLQLHLHDSIRLRKCTIYINKRNEPILKSPLIQTCSELYLKFHGYIVPSEVHLQGIENKHLTVECEWSDRVAITEMVMIWKRVRRPLGSTFTILVKNRSLIWETLTRLNEYYPGNLIKTQEHGYIHGFILDSNQTEETVLRGIEITDGGNIRHAFQVTVEQKAMN